MNTQYSRKKRYGGAALAIGMLVGGVLVLGPASPAAAATCDASARGGVLPSTANWVEAMPYGCSGAVRPVTRRILPNLTEYGMWSYSGTVKISSTSGSPAGGQVHSDVTVPILIRPMNNTSGNWIPVTFTW